MFNQSVISCAHMHLFNKADAVTAILIILTGFLFYHILRRSTCN